MPGFNAFVNGGKRSRAVLAVDAAGRLRYFDTRLSFPQ